MAESGELQYPKFFTQVEKFKDWKFEVPTKKIALPEDVEKFKKTQIFSDYMQFIQETQQSIKSKKISATKVAPKFGIILEYLEQLKQLLDQVPPLEQKMRFGNTAFKTYHQKMTEITDDFLAKLLPEELRPAAQELRIYLTEAYGSNVRIDYGSGHEMSFILFLFALHRLGYYDKADFESVIHNVFYSYLDLMRKIQLQYGLEPAGSHGVYGIDDYHFLPFLYGASELVDSEEVKSPDDIHKDSLVQELKSEYMYLDCISFIKKVKRGNFYEHSPTLNDISGAQSWLKVMLGMVKMYQAEVLFKFPVIKHTFFGTIIPFQ